MENVGNSELFAACYVKLERLCMGSPATKGAAVRSSSKTFPYKTRSLDKGNGAGFVKNAIKCVVAVRCADTVLDCNPLLASTNRGRTGTLSLKNRTVEKSLLAGRIINFLLLLFTRSKRK